MFKIGSPAVKDIATDRQILLPRFQRKRTWKDSRRFELCISLFSDYPMGTIVVKNEESPDGTRKWLLDGRQRRDTFADMLNPDNIYIWARRYLGLQARMQRDEVKKRFEEVVTNYLQFDRDEEMEDEKEGEEDLDYVEDEEPGDSQIKTVFESHKGLTKLAEVICNVHPMRKQGKHFTSNFTDPFNFGDFKMSYIEKDEEGKPFVNSEKLVKWINNHTESIKDSEIDDLKVENVLEWIDNSTDDVKKCVIENLDGIKTSIKMVRAIANRMMNSQIIVIELDDSCHSSDERKIFEIINTKGVPLTGPEIMSAKPNWNKPVEMPSDAVKESVEKMYKALEIEQKGVVKWDVAATFTDRLDPSSDFILGDLRMIPYDENSTTRFERKITSGFKLMCGRYRNSISKDEIDNLSEANCWNNNDFEDEIRYSCKLLLEDAPFKTLRDYKVSMSSFLSYTIAINYLLQIVQRYKENDVNSTNRNAVRTYKQDCRVLLDRFVYEYASNLWAGSSDARLTRNLTVNKETVFTPIPESDWNNLIDEMYSSNTINGQIAKNDAVKALLFYFSMVMDKKLNMNSEEIAEVEHIIPESKFKKDSNNQFKNSLINYALLPSSLNKEKLDNFIDSMDPSTRKLIYDLEDIDAEQAKEITGPGDIDKLKAARINKETGLPIPELVKKRRQEFVEASGYWGFR